MKYGNYSDMQFIIFLLIFFPEIFGEIDKELLAKPMLIVRGEIVTVIEQWGQFLLQKPTRSCKLILMYVFFLFMHPFISLVHSDKVVYVKQRRRLITEANAKSKSEKFPPPHQDGTLGYTLGSSHAIDPSSEVPFTSMNFSYSKEPIQTWSGPLVEPAAPRRRTKPAKKDANKKGKEIM